MKDRSWTWARLLILVAAGGLATGCVSGRRSTDGPWFDLSEAASNMGHSWRRITSEKPIERPPAWDWATGIPTGAPRARAFTATAPAQAVAHFVPRLNQNPVVLASYGNTRRDALPSGYAIRNIGGNPVRHVGDLYRALDQVAESPGPIQLDLQPVGASERDGELAVEVGVPTLLALCHSVAENQPVLTTAEDGNPWMILREGGVRAKVSLRVERNHEVLQLVLSLANCWDTETTLPVELRVTADGAPLRCLTVAETLDALYGGGLPAAPTGAAAFSFAAVSERDDYRIPFNFERLDQRLNASRRGTVGTIRPALLPPVGAPFPGSVVLGDARALSAFAWQRQPLRGEEGERVGWVMFGGVGLRDARQLEVTLDLGAGPRTVRFMLPERR